MKKSIIWALTALVVAGCANEQEKQTKQIRENVQHYMLTESDNVDAAMFAQALGIDAKFKMTMLDFCKIPVDTITDADLYAVRIAKLEDDIKAYQSLAETWQENASDRLESAEFWKSHNNRDLYDDYMETYREYLTFKEGAIKSADSINTIVTSMNDTLQTLHTPAYYVYQFQEELEMNHPVTDELEKDTLNCFAYIRVSTLAVTKVDEDVNTYVRNLDKLE